MLIEETPNPYKLFQIWLNEASASEINDPNAICLATVNKAGTPSARMVLLRDFDENGFVFYTNYESKKGHDLQETGKAAFCLYWKSLHKQIRVEGVISPVEKDVADKYFSSRPRGSQIGAWASEQSRPLSSRQELENKITHFEDMFEGSDVTRPPHWSGFRLKPDLIEFWQEGEFRLHDRLVYTKDGNSPTGWTTQKLYP